MSFDHWWIAVGQYLLPPQAAAQARYTWDASKMSDTLNQEAEGLLRELTRLAGCASGLPSEVTILASSAAEFLKRSDAHWPGLGLKLPDGCDTWGFMRADSALIPRYDNKTNQAMQWVRSDETKPLDYARFMQGSWGIHPCVFENALTEGPPPRVYALHCACGKVRNIAEFAGPQLRTGMRVRLTTQGRRIVEQTAEAVNAHLHHGSEYAKLGPPPTPRVMVGDEGVVTYLLDTKQGLWECNFPECTLAINDEMVREAA